MNSQINLNINATNNASPVIKQVAADVQGLETNVEEASEQMFDSNAVTLNSLMQIATQVYQAAEAVYEYSRAGAELEYAAIRFDRLTESIDTTSDALLGDLRDATRGLYSDAELMASAGDLMALGLAKSHDEAVRLAAVSAGLNMNMNQLVLTLTNMTTMRFDALGVSVDGFDEKLKSLEAQGYSTNDAFKEAFLQQAEDQLEKVGHAADTSLGSFMRHEAQLENMRNQYKLLTVDGIAPLLDYSADYTEALVRLREEHGILQPWEQNRLVLLEMERQASLEALDANEAHGEALMGIVTSVQELAEAEQAVAVVHGEAVKGAIQVQEAYERYGEKIQDLKLDHDELTAKKQALLEQGYYPEHSAIQTLNERLAENEQKQLDVTTAMQGTLEQMILNTAMAGLDAEAQLALARATGQIDEATYAALSVQMDLKQQYEDGILTADEYATKTLELRDAVNSLTDNNVTVTVNGIFNEIRNVMTNYASSEGGNQWVPRYAKGTDGWQEVPPGYPNDSYPIMLQSGERFAVIPAGVGASPSSAGGFGGGGMNITLVVQSPVTIMDEENARNVLLPLIESGIKELQSRGAVE